jgi:hypothetical protein
MPKRYQWGHQNPYIEKLTTQWPKDTKGVNPNPYIEEELTTQWQNSDYPIGIFWALCRLLFFDIQILITALMSFDHCFVCSSSIYRF